MWLFERGLPFDVERWEETESRIRRQLFRPSLSLMREVAGVLRAVIGNPRRQESQAERKRSMRLSPEERLDAQPVSPDSDHVVMKFAEVLSRRLRLAGIPEMNELVVDERVPRGVSDVLSSGKLADDSGPLSLLLNEPEAWRCIATPSGRRLLHLSFADVPLRAAAYVCGEENLKRFISEGGTPSSVVRSCMKSLDVTVPAPERFVHAVLGGLVFGKEEAEDWSGVEGEYGIKNGIQWFDDIREHILGHMPLIGAALAAESGSSEFLEAVRRLDSLVGEAIIEQLCRRRGECPTAAPVLVRRHEVIVEVAKAEAEKVQEWLRSIATEVFGQHLGAGQAGIEVHLIRTRRKRS